MRVAIIGRTEILYSTAEMLAQQGHEIALIVTAKAAPEYTKTAENFASLAQKLGASYFYSTNINEIAALIDSLSPIDIGISVNYPGIIPSSIIERFRLGILNAHGGDLPRYRGNACQAWAILNGEKNIGLCIHKMVGGELDSGDIIAREYYNLTHETTITEVHNWMAEQIPILFEQALHLLERDSNYILERQSMDPKDTLRCYPRKPEDGIIDWTKNSIEILRLINASTKPYSGAFTYYKGKKIHIWQARMGSLYCPSCFVPGQILWKSIVEGSVAVGTGGKGVILVDLVEIESGQLCSAAEIVLSLRDRFYGSQVLLW